MLNMSMTMAIARRSAPNCGKR